MNTANINKKDKEEINKNTKAYIGKWTPDVLKVLPESVTHIYESFPDENGLVTGM